MNVLVEFIGMILGAVHEYVPEQYIPIVDAVTAPTIAVIILIFCCAVSVFFVRAVVRSIWSGV